MIAILRALRAIVVGLFLATAIAVAAWTLVTHR